MANTANTGREVASGQLWMAKGENVKVMNTSRRTRTHNILVCVFVYLDLSDKVLLSMGKIHYTLETCVVQGVSHKDGRTDAHAL